MSMLSTILVVTLISVVESYRNLLCSEASSSIYCLLSVDFLFRLDSETLFKK